MDWSKIVCAQAKVRDSALITHSSPSRRLRRILPEGVFPQVYNDPESGEELGLISVAVERVKYQSSAMMAVPAFNFWEISFSACVFYKGIPCSFYFGFEVDTWASYAIERVSAWETEKAKIEVDINRNASGGYDLYECRSESGRGVLDFYLRAKRRPEGRAPFSNGADKRKFFLQRPHHLFKSSAGTLGDRFVAQAGSNHIREGDLLRFQSDFWVRLGLLKNEEVFTRFHNLLVTPSERRRIYPAIPSKLIPHSA